MAPPKIDLGSATLQRISRYNNDYTRLLNNNLIKMAMTFQPSVKSRVTTLPDTATEGDMYIDPANGKISLWLNHFEDNVPDPPASPSGFYQIQPTTGMQVLVQDEQKIYVYNVGWEEMFNLDAPHMGVEREISCYAPGNLRPSNATLYRYVAGLEFTIEAGAPNSGAALETAPTGNVVCTLRHNGASVGTLTFLAGSTDGTFAVPSEVIVQPTDEENMYTRAHEFSIIGPVDWLGAKGLSFTLRGKIRAID